MTREERAIQILEQRECCRECVVKNCNCAECDEAFDMAIKALEQEPRWISVSEMLPEEYPCNDGYIEPSDYVLVWGDHENYGVSRYWGNRRSKSESPNTCKDWVDLDWVVQNPIAWMPLPKPYKAGSEDKK